jgi:very-long-chain (3R)-3-hydroxyacyl-CoA dehydratase
LTEIVRYAYYATSLLKSTPPVLTWLRYSMFLVLYPVGVASELALIWNADWMPFRWLIVAAYAPGFYMLYGYMLKQRGKILSGGGDATMTKKKQK